jgi:hypothetical protein
MVIACLWSESAGHESALNRFLTEIAAVEKDVNE